MKKSTKIFSFFLALLMLAMALPMTAFAAKKETYIKEIRISTASKADVAKQYLTDNGYTVVDVDLNQKTGKGCVYIGYKTTADPDEAITDIALMQMDGGYSITEYQALLENKMKEINNMLDSLSDCLAEARANLAAGMKNAQGAREILNLFKEDDSGMLLGDFLLGQEPSREDLVKIFLQSNADVATIIYNMLAFACTDNGEDTSWLAKLEDVDVWGEYDPLVYSDAANVILESFINIRNMVLTYESEYKDIADDLASNPAYEGYTTEEIQALLPDSYAEYAVVYETLAGYKYGGKPLLDFFKQDPREIDTEEFYPLVSALTVGQREIIRFVGLTPLIALSQADETTSQEYVDAMNGASSLFSFSGEKVSVYYGVDRSLFTDGGVALTTASLRKSASTGDNSWFSGDNIDPVLSTSLHIVAGSCATIAVGCAIGARFAKKAAQTTYNAVLASETANFNATLKTFFTRLEAKATKMSAAFNGGKVAQVGTEAYELGFFNAARQAQPELAKYTSGTYCQTVAKEASASLARLGLTLNVVMGVAMGISLIAEGINMGIRLYNHLHPDYEEYPIPRALVDEVLTEDHSYYVNYYAAKDQTGEYGDLNAWGGKKWLALYTTTDKKAGDPIIASSLQVKLKDNVFPSDDHGAAHYFGETAAANLNEYQRKTSTATYIFYERDHSLSMTASTFSGGQIVMFTGFGLLGGVAIGGFGVTFAGKMKKKKEAFWPEEAPAENAIEE